MKKYTMLILLIANIFVGCSSKEVINPNDGVSESYDLAEKAKQDMYNKEGYIDGKKDGFKEGVNFMKGALAEFMNEVRAIQFSSYLIKEKYIQPGEIFIEKDGKITLGQMKIQQPYTLADIYNRFSDKIPTYAKDSTSGNTLLSDSNLPIESKINNAADNKMRNAFNSNIYAKEPEAKVINKDNIKNSFVKVARTNENEQILNKLGFQYGKMDNQLVVEFTSKDEANVFCTNLNLCLEY